MLVVAKVLNSSGEPRFYEVKRVGSVAFDSRPGWLLLSSPSVPGPANRCCGGRTRTMSDSSGFVRSDSPQLYREVTCPEICVAKCNAQTLPAEYL